MIFFFGWGHRTSVHQGPTVFRACGNCGKESWFHLFSYKTWFTLFFAPMFPYETKNVLLCPVCSRGFELKGDQFEKAKELNRLALAFLNNKLSEKAYRAVSGRIRLNL